MPSAESFPGLFVTMSGYLLVFTLSAEGLVSILSPSPKVAFSVSCVSGGSPVHRFLKHMLLYAVVFLFREVFFHGSQFFGVLLRAGLIR